MAQIVGDHRVPKMQCSGANRQVFEGHPNTPSRLLGFDYPHPPHHFKTHGVNWDIPAQFFNKFQPLALPGLQVRAVGAMKKLCDGHHRKPNIDFTLSGAYIRQDLANGLARSFGGN